MKQEKILAIIISAAMLLSVLAACEESAEGYKQPPEIEPTSITDAAYLEPDAGEYEYQQSYDIDFGSSFAAFAPDTVMMTVGGYAVTWAELFAFMNNNINSIIQYWDVHDWSDTVYEDVSFADLVLQYSCETAITYKAIEYGANLTGVTMSADDIEMMQFEYESTVEMVGGEEEVLKLLWEMDGISSRELFDYLRSIGFLASAITEELYGPNGERLADEDIAAHILLDGYLMAKHILRMKTDNDNALSEAEEILSKLNSYSGDDIESYFDELMWELSDDSDALWMFPNGYLFQINDMVQEFYEACAGIETDTYSDIVETSYGYHIIYRKPIDYDEIPTYYYNQLMYGYISEADYFSMTLRNIVALDLFDSLLYGWIDSLEVVYTAEYESMDFAKIFDLNEH